MRVSPFPPFPTTWSYEKIEIDLNGGETQVLSRGIYTIIFMDASYALVDAFPTEAHLEMYVGGAWHDFICCPSFTDYRGIGAITFYADKETIRFTNACAVGTHRIMAGVRVS